MKNSKIYDCAPAYCHAFFDIVPSENILHELEQSKQSTLQLYSTIPESKLHFAYAMGKWTTLQVLQHIIDCERVYAYRAFRFSRFDNMELSAFNENQYILSISSAKLQIGQVLNEYLTVRNSTIALYNGMSDAQLDYLGKANGSIFSARSLAFMTIGHNLHHCQVVVHKYLV